MIKIVIDNLPSLFDVECINYMIGILAFGIVVFGLNKIFRGRG